MSKDEGAQASIGEVGLSRANEVSYTRSAGRLDGLLYAKESLGERSCWERSAP